MGKFIGITAHKNHEKSWAFRVTFFSEYHICANLITDKKTNWDLYFSRNATAWASTIYFGSDKTKSYQAKCRHMILGFMFNPHTEENFEMLAKLNHYLENMWHIKQKNNRKAIKVHYKKLSSNETNIF